MVETTCPAYSEVENVFEAFIHQLTQIQDSAQQQLELFKEERAKREWNINKSRNTAQTQKKITLDIGGTVFRTTEETLLSKKDTFFSGMLSADWQPDPDTGAYFIDRGATMFPTILEYLRTGELPCIDSWSAHNKTLLERDLDFYGLNETIQPSYICWSTTPSVVFDRAHQTFSEKDMDVGMGLVQMHIPQEVMQQDSLAWTLTIQGETTEGRFVVPAMKSWLVLDVAKGVLKCNKTKRQLFVWNGGGDDEEVVVKFVFDQAAGTAEVTAQGNTAAFQCGSIRDLAINPTWLPYFATACIPTCTVRVCD
eukprot:TRINITY_DN68101_c7_g2_i3.p1 TRINITY_DN68101_c7_g2~~TRINITY_DN68101_c7_g2_i3.p1  ORF type:complete len:309 (-),score=40.03 TRINITY_DN68101_c7_g2_i3:373-1299(-)